MRTKDPVPDSAFRCLATERRRQILGYVRNRHGDTASFDDLLDHVIKQEEPSSTLDREQVALNLYHRHLPVLADHGVIDVDGRTERIRYSGDEEIETVLGTEPCESKSPTETAE
ncbi:hypothetical protein NDI76_21605 [Halogeometricum sp. S1BR25-6]|uniref:DUF7344 domain-containing protein n=1 Tax=Halogeometricum salsisoli TaxID=2950536 RepID=A0ABU2GKI6_9EURY|nr:hypothetical protein [Halogeometricum sp. S1BR25-6]MDS0301332.1 hypothetical protein [Halogeometricum sp. S1BR25-6]